MDDAVGPPPKTPKPELDSATFLREQLEDLRRRKGSHSTIVQTLEAALRSGTAEDLRRGRVVFEIWHQKGEERRLEDIPRAKPKPLPGSVPPDSSPDEEEMRVWAQAVESKMAAPKKQFIEYFWSASSEGTDFSRPDPLSTSKRRHLLAARQRPRLRPKPRWK
jgi:hypothetical protein